MLWEALDTYPFLKQWLVIVYGPQSPSTLYATLLEARRLPSAPTMP